MCVEVDTFKRQRRRSNMEVFDARRDMQHGTCDPIPKITGIPVPYSICRLPYCWTFRSHVVADGLQDLEVVYQYSTRTRALETMHCMVWFCYIHYELTLENHHSSTCTSLRQAESRPQPQDHLVRNLECTTNWCSQWESQRLKWSLKAMDTWQKDQKSISYHSEH